MGSLTAFGGSIIFAILSVVLGWLADRIGVRDALIVATLASATALLFLGRAFRRTAVGTMFPPAVHEASTGV